MGCDANETTLPVALISAGAAGRLVKRIDPCGPAQIAMVLINHETRARHVSQASFECMVEQAMAAPVVLAKSMNITQGIDLQLRKGTVGMLH